MTVYILIWSFYAPHSDTPVYAEAPYAFTKMEACTVKLGEMAYTMTEGHGQCLKTEVVK